MTHRARAWTEGRPRPNRRPTPLNRILGCIPEEPEVSANAGLWVVHQQSESEMVEAEYMQFETEYVQFTADALRSARSTAREAVFNPVDAALRVLAGPNSLWRHNVHYVDQRLAEFKHDLASQLEELVEKRVEAVVSERLQAKQRANNLLQDILARLREKAKNIELPPAEEAWKQIDASVFEDGE